MMRAWWHSLAAIPFCLAASTNVVAETETLRLLVWDGYAPAAYVSKFEASIYAQYGKRIKLLIQSASTPEAFFKAVRAGEVDVISPAHNLIKDVRYNYIQRKLLLPLNLDHIPNFKDIHPAILAQNYYKEGQHVYAVPFAHGPYGLAYNVDKVPVPTSWNVLWDPQYAKKYTIIEDYYEANIYITALALGYQGEALYNFDMLMQPVFKQKLRLLAQNASHFWQGVDTADDLHGTLLATSWGFALPELTQRGEHWAMANPKEGTLTWIDNHAICHTLRKNTFLKQVAEAWMNTLISPTFQAEVVVKTLNSQPVNVNTKNLFSATERLTHQLDSTDLGILWPTVQRQRDRNGFETLWKSATQ